MREWGRVWCVDFWPRSLDYWRLLRVGDLKFARAIPTCCRFFFARDLFVGLHVILCVDERIRERADRAGIINKSRKSVEQ